MAGAVVGGLSGDGLVLEWLAHHLEILLGKLPSGFVGLATTSGEEDAVETVWRVGK
ncbi:unannotated protein [freshwater metagenome]|uniref:Unannotated protein n=1 Tax=freshwater metagenome TaxID=449393 RepID=A0A6J6BMS5_9ZZZZ